MAQAPESAKAFLTGYLQQFGLGALGDRVWQWYLDGRPVEQITLDIRTQPEYKARFPAMEALAKRGRAMSEAAYIEQERSYAQVLRAAGLPEGFYDKPDDFAKWIEGDTSPAEVNERVQLVAAAAFRSPPEVRSELDRMFGVKPGELTSIYIDPTRSLPALRQQFLAAQIGAQARRTGFGLLTRDEASTLAGSGIDEDAAREGFATLTEGRELFAALPGTDEDEITREEQMGAVFRREQSAVDRIRRRAEQRKAAAQAGGSFSAGRSGLSGIGSARS